MQVVSCKVRLAGSVLNEVVKSDVTAPQVLVLRSVHGGADSVVDIKATGTIDVSDADERERLVALYGMKAVDKVFPSYVGLPRELPELAPAKTGRPAKKVADTASEFSEMAA